MISISMMMLDIIYLMLIMKIARAIEMVTLVVVMDVSEDEAGSDQDDASVVVMDM